ncbi:hypothetical protein CDD83_7133 [Cordyceps sp. RAO-2017]|nr:hypothetical protein CDD83_7133 [Cordyceps sp. RAO-2017]
MLPLLCQTRTLWREFATPACLNLSRCLHASSSGRKYDNSIPFDWGEENSPSQDPGTSRSTITHAEASIFKSIFEDIAKGRMPPRRKKTAQGQRLRTGIENPQRASPDEVQELLGANRPLGTNRSTVEQALRMARFRDNLHRFPSSLQDAAQVALRLYERKPEQQNQEEEWEMDEVDRAEEERLEQERAKVDAAREEERERVDGLMKSCRTDAELWKLMGREVFSLPRRLGIWQRPAGTKRTPAVAGEKKPRAKKTKTEATRAAKGTAPTSGRSASPWSMDVHGPLYSHFINSGLTLFDTAFARSSPFAFQILPHVKELGLPSYVLGVSTPFYSQLARIHWSRYGDALAALDVLREMIEAGLEPDGDVQDLLAQIRRHLHGCTWGAQGPFVTAVMESPPYDGSLTKRLDAMEQYLETWRKQLAREFAGQDANPCGTANRPAEVARAAG